jgi:hypothetical protein
MMDKTNMSNLEKEPNSEVKFISQMLSYVNKKDVDDRTKSRIMTLVEREMEKMSIADAEIIERLKRIEESLVGLPSIEENKIKYIRENGVHKPSETKSFLVLFNNSDGLKYLTHKFNDGKRDYQSFIELCRLEFENGKKKYKYVPARLLKRIEEFAFSEKPQWYIRKGNENIYPGKGWSENSFVEWYKNPINIHPDYDSKWKNEMILPFKETIEVRAGNFARIVDESIDLALGDSKDNFIIRKNDDELNLAEFYTDVDLVRHTLIRILSSIKEVAKDNLCFEIEISFINHTLNGGVFKVVEITHVNSETKKMSNDPSFVKGDLNDILKNLWGLGNYEIVSKFGDGYKKRILLTDNYEEYKNYVRLSKSIDVDKDSVEGFTHVLKFY